MIVFDDNPQSHFVQASYDAYNDAIQAYSVFAKGPRIQQRSSTLYTPTSSFIDFYIDSTPRVQSLFFDVAGLSLRRAVLESHAAEAFLGEGSGPNKRAVDESEEAESSRQASQRRRQEKQPEGPQPTPVVPQQPVPQPQQFVPPPPQASVAPPQAAQAPQQQQPYQFQAAPDERRKRKR